MGRSLDQPGLIDLQRVRLDDGQPPVTRIQLAQQGQKARILLDQHDLAGVALQDGTGQAAGAGTNLNDRSALEGAGQPDDLSRDVQVQQEMLAEALLGQQTVGFERFAKRRQVDHPDLLARRPRRRHGRGQADCRDQAVGPRHTAPSDVETCPVIGRGANDRKAQGRVDPTPEIQRLDRDQGLVVIQADRGVIGGASLVDETSCRRAWGR